MTFKKTLAGGTHYYRHPCLPLCWGIFGGFLSLVCFFFSSRRRHTRSLCDWSSDVCSSDLLLGSRRSPPRPWRPSSAACCSCSMRRADAEIGSRLGWAAPAAQQADQEPDRKNDHGAEQEILEGPVEGIEAHVRDVADEMLQALDQVEWRDAESREHDADHDR